MFLRLFFPSLFLPQSGKFMLTATPSFDRCTCTSWSGGTKSAWNTTRICKVRSTEVSHSLLSSFGSPMFQQIPILSIPNEVLCLDVLYSHLFVCLNPTSHLLSCIYSGCFLRVPFDGEWIGRIRIAANTRLAFIMEHSANARTWNYLGYYKA